MSVSSGNMNEFGRDIVDMLLAARFKNLERPGSLDQDDLSRTIKALISAYDVNVNEPVVAYVVKGKATPLMVAAKLGYNKIVEMLIANGANINVKGDEGTALDIAMSNQDNIVTHTLRSKGGCSYMTANVPGSFISRMIHQEKKANQEPEKKATKEVKLN